MRIARRPAPPAAGGHRAPGQPLRRGRARRLARRPRSRRQPSAPRTPARPGDVGDPTQDVYRFTTEAFRIEIVWPPGPRSPAPFAMPCAGEFRPPSARRSRSGATWSSTRAATAPPRIARPSSTCGHFAGRTSSGLWPRMPRAGSGSGSASRREARGSTVQENGGRWRMPWATIALEVESGAEATRGVARAGRPWGAGSVRRR